MGSKRISPRSESKSPEPRSRIQGPRHGTQDQALETLHARISAIRHAVSTQLPKNLRKGWGVGVATSPKLVGANVAAADLIVARFAAAPAEARAAGLLQKDIDTLTSERALVTGAHDGRLSTSASASAATQARNETERRILLAAEYVAAAGILEFANDKNARAPFDKLAHDAAEDHASASPAHGTPPPGTNPPAK